ncbi:hypothetical protein TNCV_507461 [Trichonephila clavipes]|nr:hypothetical protein TNCV_507461 [Trichonephila clavipes]
MSNTELQDSDFAFACGTLYEEIPTTTTDDSPCPYTVLLYSHNRPLPSKRLDLINLTSNKAETIPDELKSSALETIKQG